MIREKEFTHVMNLHKMYLQSSKVWINKPEMLLSFYYKDSKIYISDKSNYLELKGNDLITLYKFIDEYVKFENIHIINKYYPECSLGSYDIDNVNIFKIISRDYRDYKIEQLLYV